MLAPFRLYTAAFCGLATLWGPVSLQAQTAEEEAARLADAIVENRLKVTRWRAAVRAKYEGPQAREREVVGADTYVDGIRMRIDTHRRYQEGVQRPFPDRHTYRDVASYADLQYFQYSSRGKVGLYGTALVIRNKSDLRRLQTQEELISYDPRAIGHAPTQALSAAYSVPGTLKQPSERTITVEDDVLSDGTKCKKVTSTFPFGVGTYWVSPEEGPSVRRYHAQLVKDGEGTPFDRYSEQIDVKVAPWKDSGIWLPTSTHYESYEHGALVLTEDATIEFLSVNEPLDASLFEPIGFDITPGQNVYYQPSRDFQSRIWDGEKIVPVNPNARYTPSDPRGAERRGFFTSTTLLLLNAGVFVVLAFFFLAKGLRGKAG